MTAHWIKLPLEPAVLRELKVGQWVNLTGALYTARDAALNRIWVLTTEGKVPPVDLQGALLYFAGPTPAAPGNPIGAAGPTTSQRMEKYFPALSGLKLAGVMGKGPLSREGVCHLQQHHMVYLAAAGGAGAFYGSKVRGATVEAYSELGPEAIYGLQVENFPAVVAVDLEGNDLFHQGPSAYQCEEKT